CRIKYLFSHSFSLSYLHVLQRLGKRYIIPFLFIFAGFTAAAQEKVDSLRSAFFAESDDSLKCLTLDRMLFHMRSKEMVDSALHYGRVLKALAKSDGLRYFQARGHIAVGCQSCLFVSMFPSAYYSSNISFNGKSNQ